MPWTSTCRRCRRTGAACSAATRLVDVAHKVVGVGSRRPARLHRAAARAAAPTTWCSCSSSRRGDRSWRGSCTATRPGTPTRVSGWCEYQQALQTVSDPLLGWTTVGRAAVLRAAVPRHEGRHRRGRDRRAGAWPTTPASCGHLLAKGHARTSGASMIAGYLGGARQGRPRRCAGSPAPTPTRPSATTRPCWCGNRPRCATRAARHLTHSPPPCARHPKTEVIRHSG